MDQVRRALNLVGALVHRAELEMQFAVLLFPVANGVRSQVGEQLQGDGFVAGVSDAGSLLDGAAVEEGGCRGQFLDSEDVSRVFKVALGCLSGLIVFPRPSLGHSRSRGASAAGKDV